ncbi:uncharacterized protein N7469_010486 [Penicillium citrinum]|uniref:Uncharacterized protein n=2 Tax=Penicillium TaxID=5073 RepID=A0A9W9TGK2_PENCI|nr:uncharacterized protein N7469_010486 [Penicillium citrinum]KAJ5221599.1 hypothetical protein N7469_010486 [Penicillium citrinum]KAJ5596565.1 hypothetical protein N7450_003023 [Penicillium hetheringtonii]
MSGQDDTKSLKEKVLSILPSHDASRAKEFDNESKGPFRSIDRSQEISALAVAAAARDMPGRQF